MKHEDNSLMTPLGIVSGEVLLFIEKNGKTTLRNLIHELPWPATLIVMGVGVLIRNGLIQGVQQELEVILEMSSQPSEAGLASLV